MVVAFRNLEEDAPKFILSWYHSRKLWLRDPLEITHELIVDITILLAVRYLVPMGSKNCPLVKEFTRTKTGNNSKRTIINQIQNLSMEWTTIIVFVCLTISSRPSYVKQEMMEAIKHIAYGGKKYKSVSHVVGLVR